MTTVADMRDFSGARISRRSQSAPRCVVTCVRVSRVSRVCVCGEFRRERGARVCA
jgi:hypothetical protein